MSNDEALNFLAEEPIVSSVSPQKHYKVMIADDDSEVHVVTKMILQSFEYEGKGILFVDAYTGEEAKQLLRQHEDIAVIFLDVVMEDLHTGLEVVTYLREVLNNQMTRIILRTGQPGEAPEDRIIREYDINDYRLKTDMTVSRLNTSLYTALRNVQFIYG